MLIWKGKNVKDLGIIVENIPVIPKAKKIIDVYTVPGRNGFVSVDTNAYDTTVITVPCHFKDGANFEKIKSFLDGYGTLSVDGEKEYTAIIQNSIEFEQVLMFKKFAIQFLINPIAKDIEENIISISSTSTSFEILKATTDMYPIIKITGSGDATITINNNSFVLKNMDGKYILDCDLKIITSNGLNAANHMQYDFPKLVPGINNIDYVGDITNFEITYRRAYL